MPNSCIYSLGPYQLQFISIFSYFSFTQFWGSYVLDSSSPRHKMFVLRLIYPMFQCDGIGKWSFHITTVPYIDCTSVCILHWDKNLVILTHLRLDEPPLNLWSGCLDWWSHTQKVHICQESMRKDYYLQNKVFLEGTKQTPKQVQNQRKIAGEGD